jgi:hypothetical protein
MTQVIVERHWDSGLSDADMQEMMASCGGCLALHRCDWRGSLLSLDGHELLCHFSAPDVESVRIALQQAGAQCGSVWPGTIHEAPGLGGTGMAGANVLVSRQFPAAVALQDIQAIEDAGQVCLDNHRVRFVRTYFATDRRRMVCLYRAPDAESVRIAQREAGMPVERIWAFRSYAP